MRNRVEKYFPSVLEIVEEEFRDKINNGGIPNEFKGYISSFGAMVTDSGLLPALAFFEKNDDGATEERVKIINVMKKFLIKKNKIPDKSGKLVKLIIGQVTDGGRVNYDQLRIYESMIIDIAIALKLALRTFLEKKD